MLWYTDSKIYLYSFIPVGVYSSSQLSLKAVQKEEGRGGGLIFLCSALCLMPKTAMNK